MDARIIIQGRKYRWLVPPMDTAVVTQKAGKFNLSVPIIQTLLARGCVADDAIERFLFSSKERDVSSAALMKDAERAVDRLLKAIENNEKILIAGDYDVDGITSSSLLLMCLLPLGAQINFFLPNRARDGYGLSVKTVERAARNGYGVIITVDNGITAFEPARVAKELGIDLIITDHHRPHDHVPDAYAIVNPHQADCPYPFKSFAGVGVGFKLMSLLYEKLQKPLPTTVYELLLLGTVADVVPLVEENRFWVRHGLQYINFKGFQSTALGVLKENARVTKPALSSTDIGFFITPQINALGRLDDPRDGVKFLMSTDPAEVNRIGSILANLNEARKSVEKNIIADIEADLKERNLDMTRERVVVATSPKWPTGVIGLAASRIVGLYNRPTFLFHITSDGIAKGSCRSIPGFSVFDALTEVKDLLITFGGHAAAAGLSLPVDKIPEFSARMSAIVDRELTPDDLVPTVQIDAELTLREVTSKLLADLAFLEPFGCENRVPLFVVRGASLIGEAQLLKEAHVKCMIFADGIMKPVIFFNRPEIFPLLKEGRFCDVAVHVLENNWKNETRVELQGIDIVVHP